MKVSYGRSIFVAFVVLVTSPSAKDAPAQTPPAAPAVEAATAAILGNPKVIKTLEDIKADDDRALAEQKLVVSAHLDTVFPEGTDVTVKEKDGVILAPGIGDDSRGLAALLSLIQAMNANQIATVGDVLFVGTVAKRNSAICAA
jgi:tripeptide aminopeptidase